MSNKQTLICGITMILPRYCGNTFVGGAKEICVCNGKATKIRLTEEGENYFIRNGKND